jgi:hypothetical protein
MVVVIQLLTRTYAIYEFALDKVFLKNGRHTTIQVLKLEPSIHKNGYVGIAVVPKVK